MFERSGSPVLVATDRDQSAEGRARFIALWRRCLTSDATAAETAYDRLINLYGEPHRHYHTLIHIRHCLDEFDPTAARMDDPDAVEMALWFHDAIYQPGAMDNEWRSAELFRQWSEGLATPAFRQRVHDLVMATTHREPPRDRDAGFTMDIDLSGFGLPWEQCEQEGRLIRAEFADRTDDEYYPGHLRFLLALHHRPTFFFTEWFQRRYESAARANVAHIIAGLRARGYR